VLTSLKCLGMMYVTKEKEMKNGTSTFTYEIMGGLIELECRVEFDEYETATLTEALYDGVDVTEYIIQYGLEDEITDSNSCGDNFERD